MIYPRLGVLVGPVAVEAFSKIHADVAIMSAGGISLEGITNSHGLLIDIQRAMIKAAQKVIFCLDHTKFGRQSVLPLCGLDSADTIVTDSAAPADLVEALRARVARSDCRPRLLGQPAEGHETALEMAWEDCLMPSNAGVEWTGTALPCGAARLAPN